MYWFYGLVGDDQHDDHHEHEDEDEDEEEHNQPLKRGEHRSTRHDEYVAAADQSDGEVHTHPYAREHPSLWPRTWREAADTQRGASGSKHHRMALDKRGAGARARACREKVHTNTRVR